MVHTYILIQEFVSAVKCGDKEKVRSLLQNTEIDIDTYLPDVRFMFVVHYCLLHTHGVGVHKHNHIPVLPLLYYM